MLVLSLKESEIAYLGEPGVILPRHIEVKVCEIRGTKVRLGFEAAEGVAINTMKNALLKQENKTLLAGGIKSMPLTIAAFIQEREELKRIVADRDMLIEELRNDLIQHGIRYKPLTGV